MILLWVAAGPAFADHADHVGLHGPWPDSRLSMNGVSMPMNWPGPSYESLRASSRIAMPEQDETGTVADSLAACVGRQLSTVRTYVRSFSNRVWLQHQVMADACEAGVWASHTRRPTIPQRPTKGG